MCASHINQTPGSHIMYYYILLTFFIITYFSHIKNSNFIRKLDHHLKLSLPRDRSEIPAIGFVLAHPDDESMFFLPTLNVLKSITSADSGFKPRLHFLYLSNGDYNSDGRVREHELDRLCTKYNYACSVIDDYKLRDGKTQWDPESALEYITQFVKSNNIAVLFTFDSRGVSGHPNHIGTHYSVKLAAESFRRVKVFYLESFNLLCKYSGFLSVFQLFFKRDSVVSFSPLDVFANMCIHKSQLRFHVPLWSLFSSYSYINSYLTA